VSEEGSAIGQDLIIDLDGSGPRIWREAERNALAGH